MTELQIQAIKKLPARFVKDGTQVAAITNPSGLKCVIAMHPDCVPIVYWESTQQWAKMRFKQEQG